MGGNEDITMIEDQSVCEVMKITSDRGSVSMGGNEDITNSQ